jgi:hypothetical protein
MVNKCASRGEQYEVCEQNDGPMKKMFTPSVPKVNLSHLAYFDTHRDRFVVEAAPLLVEQFLPLQHWERLHLPSGGEAYHWI